MMTGLGPVSWIVLAPALAGTVMFFVPERSRRALQALALAAVSASALLAGWAFAAYDRAAAGYQFVDRIPWVPRLGISLHFGVDGINLVLLVMTSVLAVAGVVVTFSVTERFKEYLIFYLFLVAGCLGVLASLDLFFLYFFYEMAVIPVFPLIGVWGSGNKEYATMKLTLYLTAGALLALVAILSLYFASGAGTFDLTVIEAALAARPLPVDFQRWAFPLVMVGFGVILTLWPFHTWSPMGYAAAPTSVSMLHAGVLKKLGAYAILRVGLGLMPDGAVAWMPVVAGLAAVNILYCGLVAFTQRDLKYILGYSSCSHMGYILLGLACLTPTALDGTVFFMFAHGLMAALGFALVGFIYQQTHTRTLDEWGGLGKKVPFVATLFVMTAMASSGLPGFANFIGEMMILVGAWDTHRLSAVAAVAGLVVTAGYSLMTVRGALQGPLNAAAAAHLEDARGLARAPYLLLIGLLLAAGFVPSLLLPTISSGTRPILERLETAKAAVRTEAGR